MDTVNEIKRLLVTGNIDPILHELSENEVSKLNDLIDVYIKMWYGFDRRYKEKRTPQWVEQARKKMDSVNLVEPCCECGGDYPRSELHFEGEIYCGKCRKDGAERVRKRGVIR